MKKTTSENGTRVGFAEVGAYLHRDNGGKASIKAYTSVNKPHTVDAHEETTRIAAKRYEIHEVELPKLNGEKFYEKDFWNEQHNVGGETHETQDNTPTEGNEDPEKEEKGDVGPHQFLKNMIDNIDKRLNTDISSKNNIAIAIGVCAAILGAVALGISLM